MAWLQAGLQALAPRGPDASSHWQGQGVLLGHRRLSIRDLSPTGAQPMASASGQSTIVYNGELYGFTALAADLARQGWQPRGHSDTELIVEQVDRLLASGAALHLPQHLQQHNGMFAWAHWHAPTATLYLARDRVGIKPLYIAQAPGLLAFCSEPAPLLRLPWVDRALDPAALSLYLALGNLPAPFSLARGVRQLAPGSVAAFDPQRGLHALGQLQWPQVAIDAQLVGRRADELLDQAVLAAVERQLVSDVPVGVLLSGGVDSSVVAAAAAKLRGPVQTFSVVHSDPRYDERHAAQAVARHIGSQHTELHLPPGGLTQAELDQLLDRTGDPFADSSALPMGRLAKLVREHVTVALSGDGGDEVFAGYPRYLIADRLLKLQKVPELLRHAGLRAWGVAAPHLPHPRLLGPGRRLARALQASLLRPARQAVATTSLFWPEEAAHLLQPGLADQTALDRHLGLLGADGAWIADAEAVNRLEQRLVLPDDMLVKVDRMAMAASLEVRPPLLDDELLVLAARLPWSERFGGGEGKVALKRLARRWVPPQVVDRPKQGFAIPLRDFGGALLQDLTRWALQGQDSPLQRLFTASALRQFQGEFDRRGDGLDPEDSEFRRIHRQWALVLLALSLQRSGIAL
jgi:asparagine synthase (glutamine-hydrolysing)